MASVFWLNGEIDYSLVDGRIREFELDGKILFSEYQKVEKAGWEDTAIQTIKAVGLQNEHIAIDKNNEVVMAGHHLFVHKLVEDGKLEYGEPRFTFAGIRGPKEVAAIKKKVLEARDQ